MYRNPFACLRLLLAATNRGAPRPARFGRHVRRAGVTALLSICAALPLPSFAANIQWNGSFNNQWGFTFNWDGVGIGGLTRRVPADFDSATLSNTTNGTDVFLNGDTAAINGLSISNGMRLFSEGYVLTLDDGFGTAAIDIAGAGTTLFIEDSLVDPTDNALVADQLSIDSGYVEIQTRADITDNVDITGTGELWLTDFAFVTADSVALGSQLFSSGRIRLLGGSRLVTSGPGADSIGTWGSSVLDVLATSVASFGDLNVGGVAGDPTINVQSGGALLYNNLQLGGSSSSTDATLNVSGTNSLASHSQAGAVDVGGTAGQGTGTINLTDGGRLSVSQFGMNVHATGTVKLTDTAGVGGTLGTFGNILIDGGHFESSTNSTFTVASGADITINNQGVMKLSHEFELGDGSNLSVNNGTFQLFGNSTDFVAGDGGTSIITVQGPDARFEIGGFAEIAKNQGNASLTLSDGAFADVGRLTLDDSGANFTTSVVNILSGATLDSFAAVTVASNGFSSSAALDVSGTDSKITLSPNAPLVIGAGSVSANSSVTVADAATIELLAGAGFINVFTNGVLTIDDASVVSAGTGGLNNFGVVHLDNNGNLSLTAGDFNNFGTLNGNGVVDLNGHVFDNSNGVIAPGNSPGELTINAAALVSDIDSVIEIEIAGRNPGQFDQLSINGTFASDGTLKIVLLDGFLPTLGETFDIILATAFSGEFDFIDCSLCGAREFDLVFTQAGLSLEVTAIPLPATVWMLLGAVVVLFRRREVISDEVASAA